MRILSLGIGLPDYQIDNYDWASALSFFDYDAMIVDPVEAVSKLAENVPGSTSPYTTYTTQPIEDGPTTAASVGLADLLRRRRDETERLLARGGIVVCFAHPDVAHPRVSGFTGCHRYYWLQAPAGTDYSATYLKPGMGNQVTVEDFEHPFADLLESTHSFLYQAYFTEGEAGFGDAAKVLARSPGGAAVAVEFALGGGRVIFLPALQDNLPAMERSAFATKVVTAIRNTLLLQAEGRAPLWINDHPLPGIVEARAAMDEAEAKIDAAEGELAQARSDYVSIDRYRRLLWQEGKYGLDLPVRDALALLGFVPTSQSDEPASFYYGGETVLVETQGSREAIGLPAHYRLRQRIEAKIARDSQRPFALLIVNGYRDMPPQQRQPQYEEALRVASESMRYAVVESVQLFQAVRDHMEGRGDDATFCRAMIHSEGIFQPPEPSPDAVAAGSDATEQENDNNG